MAHGIVTHTVDVYRLARTGNTEQYGASPVFSGLDCAIFPASTEILAVYLDLPAFATYEVFVYENATLQNGDKLKFGAEEYILRGVPQVYDNNYMYYQRLIAEKVI